MKILSNEIKKNRMKIALVIVLLLILTGINVIQPLITQKIIDDGLYEKNIEIVIRYAVLSFLMYFISFMIGLSKERIVGSVFYESEKYEHHEIIYSVNSRILEMDWSIYWGDKRYQTLGII